MLRARALGRGYQRGEDRVEALRDVSLEVDQGEFVSVAGPSGSGKTTLLNVLGLLDPGFEGQLWFAGQDVAVLSAAQRARLRLTSVGFVFQAFNLLSALDVRDNVALPHLRLHGGWRRARQRAEGLLAEFGLEQRLKHRPSQLSAGEMQRVAVARALINEPRLVLADEPTGNLDATSTKYILAALSSVVESGKTLMVISHDPEVVAAAPRVIRMRYGRLEGASGD